MYWSFPYKKNLLNHDVIRERDYIIELFIWTERDKKDRKKERKKGYQEIIIHRTSSQDYEKGIYNILQSLASLYIEWNSFIMSLWI